MESFTYLIRSENKESGTNNNCYIRLNGLPSGFNEFQISVNGFHIENYNFETEPTSFIEVRSSDLGITNSYDTKYSKLRTICLFTTATFKAHFHTFKTSCWNGKTVQFQLFNDAGNAITAIDKPWILSLNVVPIKNR
jgi:hypothetical protein